MSLTELVKRRRDEADRVCAALVRGDQPAADRHLDTWKDLSEMIGKVVNDPATNADDIAKFSQDVHRPGGL